MVYYCFTVIDVKYRKTIFILFFFLFLFILAWVVIFISGGFAGPTKSSLGARSDGCDLVVQMPPVCGVPCWWDIPFPTLETHGCTWRTLQWFGDHTKIEACHSFPRNPQGMVVDWCKSGLKFRQPPVQNLRQIGGYRLSVGDLRVTSYAWCDVIKQYKTYMNHGYPSHNGNPYVYIYKYNL